MGELIDLLAPPDTQSPLRDGFDMAQNLHHNFYENEASEVFVTLGVQRVAHFIDDMLPWLRRARRP